MNIPARRPAPSYLKRFRRLVLEGGRLNTANFTDVFGEVYGDRPVFFLDRSLSFKCCPDDKVTYRTLSMLTSRIGNGLKELGVKPGDRVGLMTMNRVELALAEFAAWKIGAVPVPLNFMLKAEEVRYQMENSGARVLITDRKVFEENIRDPGLVPCVEHWIVVGEGSPVEGAITLEDLADGASDALEPYEPRDAEETAIIFYTSGTTGVPRGAELSHKSMLFTIRNYARLLALIPTNTRQLALLVMPVAHTSGHQNMLILIAMAIPMVFVSRFDPAEVGRMIQEHRVTFFAGIPTMFKMMLAAGVDKYDLSSMQVWGGGADAFTPDLVRTFRQWGGWKIGPLRIKSMFVRGYGLAETGGHVCLTPPWPVEGACAGWVVPMLKWRLVDELGRPVNGGKSGELVLKGPTITKGYYNDAAKTRDAFVDGWFRTGDIMRRGRLRLLYFMEREKDVVKCGGYSIFPSEIEHHLVQHPDVQQAVVIGVPDEIKGQLPVAVIVPRPGAEVKPEEIMAWVREHMAHYKCPRKVVVVNELPMTFSFKPKRAELRKMYEYLFKQE
jgi:long-chain acyl-CoA synthetase